MKLSEFLAPIDRRRGFHPITAGLLGLTLLASPALADGADMIEEGQRNQMIETLGAELEARYVFPETAQSMAKSVKKANRKGHYDDLADGEALAAKLTEDLQAISHDKHLRVRYSAEPMSREEASEPSEEEIEMMKRKMAMRNYGFEKVERMAGNIGYLDLRGFMDPSLGGDTAHAAMAFLANSDALIIDLRRNGGGSPEMIQLLSSYLFAGSAVHLNSLYWRNGDVTQQFWTLPHVPGVRRPDVDVYILTSDHTFSAAEEFTYNLQNLKRATIVGETTGGGAHPGGTVALDEHFMVWMPMGRAINPISGTNWEGTGVVPDHAVEADKALDTAWLMALEKRVQDEPDARVKAAIEEKMIEIQSRLASEE